ncbi:hypothetical protein VZ94_14870, partial [Methylocucumis oryzae]
YYHLLPAKKSHKFFSKLFFYIAKANKAKTNIINNCVISHILSCMIFLIYNLTFAKDLVTFWQAQSSIQSFHAIFVHVNLIL